jgi:tRNA-dihydrouridine synthase
MSTPENADKPALWLAPIRGVTNAFFREQFARIFGGFDGALAPFVVPNQGRLPPLRHLHDAMPASNPSLPTIPQILTECSTDFVAVARVYLDAGCPTVNWNLGCPFPMVTRRGRGAGLLPYPERIDAFLDDVVSHLGGCVSVKLRLGLRSEDEAAGVFDVLNRFPLTDVILHPRTATQMYRGHVNLDAFAACLQSCRHPLAYNGDIVDVTSFRRMQSAFPSVRQWMIGRGAVSNPFLPSALAKGEQVVKGDMAKLEGFHRVMLEHHRSTLSGDAHVLHKMQELWSYWATSFAPKSKPVKKVLRAKRMEAYERCVGEVFDGAALWGDCRAGGP